MRLRLSLQEVGGRMAKTFVRKLAIGLTYGGLCLALWGRISGQYGQVALLFLCVISFMPYFVSIHIIEPRLRDGE